jgi:hypothetical protein
MDIEGTDGELRPGEDDPTDGSDASDGSDHTWTRRGLIAGVAAAGAGAAVGMVGGSAVAGAGGSQGGNFILGETTNTATGTTGVVSSTQGAVGLSGAAPAASGLLDGVLDGGISAGVVGDTSDGYGLVALTGARDGYSALYAEASGDGSTAVYGYVTGFGSTAVSALDGSSGGTAVSGESDNGIGLRGSGGTAPLLLIPAAFVGAPTSGTHQVGEIVTDSTGAVFACIGDGSPGQWGRVSIGSPQSTSGAFCLLSAPIRLLDTRTGATAPTSPGHPVEVGVTLDLPVTGQSVGGIEVPTGAVAVIGNVTAVNAEAHGYLTLWPAGVARPGTSSLNFPVSASQANGVTVALSAAGVLAIYASQTTDVIFDATGYIA